jgi:hypothetical protein
VGFHIELAYRTYLDSEVDTYSLAMAKKWIDDNT